MNGSSALSRAVPPTAFTTPTSTTAVTVRLLARPSAPTIAMAPTPVPPPPTPTPVTLPAVSAPAVPEVAPVLPSLIQSCFETPCPVEIKTWHCLGGLRESVRSDCGKVTIFNGLKFSDPTCNAPDGLNLSSLTPEILGAMDTAALQAFLAPLAKSFVRIAWVDGSRHTRTRHGFLRLIRSTEVHAATAIALLMLVHNANVQMGRVLAVQPGEVCTDLLHLRPGRVFSPDQMRQIMCETVAQICRNPNDHALNDPLRDGCAALVSQYLAYCHIIVKVEDGPGSILRRMRRFAANGRPLPFRLIHCLGSANADVGMNQGSLRLALDQMYTPPYQLSIDEAVQYSAITFAGTQKYVNSLKQRDQRDVDIFNLVVISLLAASARLPLPISLSSPLMGAIGIVESSSSWKVRDLNAALATLKTRLIERPAKTENKIFGKVETPEVVADFMTRLDLTQRSILI